MQSWCNISLLKIFYQIATLTQKVPFHSHFIVLRGTIEEFVSHFIGVTYSPQWIENRSGDSNIPNERSQSMNGKTGLFLRISKNSSFETSVSNLNATIKINLKSEIAIITLVQVFMSCMSFQGCLVSNGLSGIRG